MLNLGILTYRFPGGLLSCATSRQFSRPPSRHGLTVGRGQHGALLRTLQLSFARMLGASTGEPRARALEACFALAAEALSEAVPVRNSVRMPAVFISSSWYHTAERPMRTEICGVRTEAIHGTPGPRRSPWRARDSPATSPARSLAGRARVHSRMLPSLSEESSLSS